MEPPPVRPAGVPGSARFDPELDGFELDARDDLGRRSGESRVFRAGDGTLDWVCTYREGVRDGPFSRFHPNGQPAQRGSFTRGVLDGEVIAYGSDAPTTLPLQRCCVPAGAWELRSTYRAGRLLRQVFYDREGFPLTHNGTRWPARPSSVDADAEYDDESDLWLLRRELAGGVLLLRRFGADGLPLNETEYRNGMRTCERRLDAAGLAIDEYHFDEDGRYHGPSTRWFSEGESPALDPSISEERGQFWHGHPVGTFTWLDREAEVVARRELGAGLTDASLGASEVFATELDHEAAAVLWESCERLRCAGRLREAVILAARAAAREGSVERLLRWVGEARLDVRAEVANAMGEAVRARTVVTANDVLSAFLLGADTATAFRTLAGVLHGRPRAALDIVEAAILLAPDARAALVTRALVRVELGQKALALEDAANLESEAPHVSEHLRESVRLFFPEFSFWPLRESLEPAPPEAVTVEVRQPVVQIRRQIGVYATRLVRLGERARTLLGEGSAAWSWPELGHLLPRGLVELEQRTALIEDRTDDGVETTELTIDEALDLDGDSVAELAARARANWSALCWLCWAAGLDDVALPDALDPRVEFTAAVNTALVRYARVRDQTQTGGLVSRARGAADFAWEGTSIAVLDARFVALALAEYAELRALFFWLMFEENVSPFQSDIRES